MCSRVYLFIYNIKSVYVSMSEKSCRKQGRDFDMTRAMMLTAVWYKSNSLQILIIGLRFTFWEMQRKVHW